MFPLISFLEILGHTYIVILLVPREVAQACNSLGWLKLAHANKFIERSESTAFWCNVYKRKKSIILNGGAKEVSMETAALPSNQKC